MVRIGINGFGRIGRLTLRSSLANPKTHIVAINDPFIDIEHMVYLFRHDSTHGKFRGKVIVEDGKLVVNGLPITIYSERDPAAIPWHKDDVEYVAEATGLFTTMEQARAHLKGGAKKVVICAPSADAPMFVLGVNHKRYKKEEHHIISIASCTTNCVTPMAKLLNREWGVVEGLMTAIRSYTATHKTVDGPNGKRWRDGRGAQQNIIPASTEAAVDIGRVYPKLAGKFTGVEFHVPTPDVSVVDLTVRLEKPATMAEIKEKFKDASETAEWVGIIGYTDEESVSTDFIHDSTSCVLDFNASIMLNDKFVKLVAWYDNEWAYSSRVTDMIDHMQDEPDPWHVDTTDSDEVDEEDEEEEEEEEEEAAAAAAQA